MSAAPNAAMPVFSYAQAAKGAKSITPPKPLESLPKDEAHDQSAKSSQKSEPTSNAPSRASRSRPRTQDKDVQSITQESSPDASLPPAAPAPEQSLDKESLAPTRRTVQRSEPSQDSTSAATSPKPTREIGSPKEKDFLNKADRTDSWEKASQVSNPQEKSAAGDKDKTKDSEDDWEKVSLPSVTAEKELKAAPLPVVNVWAARLEAQAAKKKDFVAPTPTPNHAPATSARPKAVADDSKRRPGGKDSSDKDVSHAGPKPDSSSKATAEQLSAQTSRPASQQRDKAAGFAPPPVDTTSWPTPESAIVDERRKSSNLDKTEKQEGKTNGTKSHGNKWIAVPFVPTAKFETPLPALAAKRGSGNRSGRGRDGQSRGNHSGNNGERQEPGAMGPPPIPNKSNDQDRGRKSEGQRGGRASSLPTNNRRATSRESTLAALRKPAAPMKDTNVQAENVKQSNTADNQNAAATFPTGSKELSRSSSRQEDPGTGNASNSDVLTSQAPEQNGVEPYPSSVTEGGGRSAYGQDRAKPQSTYRPSADPSRERAAPRHRDFSREKSDAAREKVESWRDRDFSGESNGRRERSDRGRGGYRGRGTHLYNAHQGHPYTSPLPQNGFEPAKTAPNGEPRSRQSSQPFAVANPPNANRNNSRAYSIPVGLMYQNPYGMSAMPQQGLSSIQTDMSGYAYPNQPPMEQGVMSAMPYNNSLNSYAVMSMVVSQIEYYFSIDNLCKDMFLRKNMDSQGWVPLRVVASFKRIKALTEDNFPWEMMRYVCSQVRNIDHLPAGDGEDKLRSRENWRDFILPMNERFPTAQNDGPQIPHMHPQQPAFVPQGNHDGLSAMSPPIRSPPAGFANVNGLYESQSPQTYAPIPPLDGSVAERGFTSILPSPAQDLLRREPTNSPKVHHPRVFRDRPNGNPIYSPAANGHRRQSSRNFNEEILFPDEDIAEIRICVQEPPADSTVDDASTRPQVSRVLSNESRSSASDVQRVSGLRGGHGAQEQSAFGLQGMVFGSSGNQTTTETVSFINKDGQPSQIPAAKPGQYFITYPECHAESFKNRALGVPDAMKTLYIFWSTFLVDKFNLGMYREFKTVAIDDLAEGDDSGMAYLMEYYQAALKLHAPISEAVAGDLVQFLRDEKDGKARVYKMMRLAWRNGALNLKTRKRIGDLLSDEEKSSFDKGG